MILSWYSDFILFSYIPSISSTYIVNGYELILEPSISRQDIAYWINFEIEKQKLRNKYAVINCSIEESTVGARSCHRLLPQDQFILDHIDSNDILVISIGGNDIALKPTPWYVYMYIDWYFY